MNGVARASRGLLELLAWSAVLQFPLAYVPAALIALSVYGMSFLTAAGYVVLVAAGGIALVHRRLAGTGPRGRGLCQGATASAPCPDAVPAACCPAWILIGGALFTAWGYRSLHMGYYDGRSVADALFLAASGLWSLLAAHGAAAWLACVGCRASGARGAEHESNGSAGAGPGQGRPSVFALAILAAVWLCAAAYPLIALLWCAVVMALSVMLTRPSAGAAMGRGGTDRASGRPGVWALLLFLLAMDFSAVIYDYGVVTEWGVHMAALMGGAAVGVWLAPYARRNAAAALAVCAGGNYIAAVLIPAWLLNPAHNAVAGVALGWVMLWSRRLSAAAASGADERGRGAQDDSSRATATAAVFPFGSAALVIALGMAVSYWIAQNLALNWLRLVFAAAATAAAWRRRDCASRETAS